MNVCYVLDKEDRSKCHASGRHASIDEVVISYTLVLCEKLTGIRRVLLISCFLRHICQNHVEIPVEKGCNLGLLCL